jgi:signal transduction histidine kinase
VIGSAVLAIGLLLIASALAAARIPGGATLAPSGIAGSPGRDRLRAFVLSPIHPATWYANGAIVLGLFVGLLSAALIGALISTGLTVLVAGIGLVFIAIGIEGSRLVARMERWRAFVGRPVRPPPHPYRPLRGGGVFGALRGEFADESRWRDVLYVAINLPLSAIEFVVVATAWTLALSLLTSPIWYDAARGETLPGLLGFLAAHDPSAMTARTLAGLALLPVVASLSQLVIALHRGVVGSVLCTSEERELRRQVETLRKSRAAVLDVEASELHRIERDLHDGAQQQLVALTIDLGRAGERIESDPAAARQLILEGQVRAREALSELRDLVRGIAPAILLDRGLVPALQSIAGRGPVPAVLVSDLSPDHRLPLTTERTAYFVAAEAVANVSKHSSAEHCEIRCRREGTHLVVEVWDDGSGGARIEPGGGLEGLAKRVAGVDGTLSVSSPAGGPTLVRAEIPIVEGSPVAGYEPR